MIPRTFRIALDATVPSGVLICSRPPKISTTKQKENSNNSPCETKPQRGYTDLHEQKRTTHDDGGTENADDVLNTHLDSHSQSTDVNRESRHFTLDNLHSRPNGTHGNDQFLISTLENVTNVDQR